MTSIADCIGKGKKLLTRSSGTPGLDAELLLCSVMGITREDIFRNPERTIAKPQEKTFLQLLEKRTKGMPIAYLTKTQEFFGIPIGVSRGVLIPRPETEEVVEDAINFWKKHQKIQLFLDIGTGSGCIAIALSKTLPGIRVIALEKYEKALAVAKQNRKKQDCEKNITILKSDLLSALPKKELKIPKIIIANLPYIGTQTNNFMAANVQKFEPKEALLGGKDGLDLYRKLMDQIVKKNIHFDAMFFEIGFSQTEIIEREIRKRFPKRKLQIKRDLAGFPRTVQIT